MPRATPVSRRWATSRPGEGGLSGATGRGDAIEPPGVPRRGTLCGVFGEIMWTQDSEEHIARHGVSPDEVEEAVYVRPRLVAPGATGTTLVYCTTSAGRHLLVVLAEALDGRDYVVTARDMTNNEKRAFRRRRQ